MTHSHTARGAGRATPESGEAPSRDESAQGFRDQGRADRSHCAQGRGGTGAELGFRALRDLLAPFGWVLTRTDASDGPQSFYATRKGKVRHLPDLAAVAALAHALAPKREAGRTGKPSRRWRAVRTHAHQTLAGAVPRVRAALPADLVRWLDREALHVECAPGAEWPWLGRTAWSAFVLAPFAFDLRQVFELQSRCAGRVRAQYVGGCVLHRRLFVVFELWGSA